jgi:hypothetical protein
MVQRIRMARLAIRGHRAMSSEGQIDLQSADILHQLLRMLEVLDP